MASGSALAFFLDGPLQSWGVSSRFQRRGSESFPTKSGVLGLLAAALGIDKNAEDEAEHLAPIRQLRLTVYRVEPLERSHPVVRLEDFHTVGGGYDAKDPVERLRISHKASGGPSTTIITHRTYLTDARFAVVLEGDSAVLERCREALQDPRWGVWFGRKSCLPASPLAPTPAPTGEESLNQLLTKLGTASSTTWQAVEGREEVAAVGHSTGVWFAPDQPVSFGKREFRSRPVKRS